MSEEKRQSPTAGGDSKPLRPFFVLWSAQALSLVGTMAVQFALIWWLTIETGSATVLATAALVGLLPTALLGPLIGALVDRWNRKRVMLVADAAVALASALLAVLFLTGTARIEHVFVLLLLRGIGGAFHGPAMLASTSLMVPEEHLTRIQGLNQALQGGLLIISAPLGALLVVLLPMAGVMAVDVATALIAILPLLFIHVPQPTASAETEQGSPSVWREVVAGLRYVRDRRGHLVLLAMAALINMCLVPAFSLLPLLVSQGGGGAARLGWVQALFGVGTIAGGILLGIWGGFRQKILTTLTGLIGMGLATVALGAVAGGSLALLFGASFAVGFMVPVTNGPIQALLQATVAPDFQGRVFMLYSSLATLTTPLGLALAAPIAELAGVPAWYYAGGLICAAMGALGYFVPALLEIERDGREPAREPEAAVS